MFPTNAEENPSRFPSREVSDQLDTIDNWSTRGTETDQLICAVSLEHDGQRSSKWSRTIEVGQRLIIGRGSDADLSVAGDRHMSRSHCSICCSVNCVEVRDLGSRNGTILHGQKVSRAVLSDGDQLVIGSMLFTVRVHRAES